MLNQLCNIRFAVAEADLQTGWLLYSYEFAEPALATWSDGAGTVSQSTGGTVWRGQQAVSIVWNNIHPVEAIRIRDIIESALSGPGTMHITANKAWRGKDGQDSWVDCKGVPSIPAIAPQANTKGSLIPQFALVVSAIEVVQDPAVGV